MLMDVYFEEMKKILKKVENSQREKIAEVAKEIANRLAGGSAWHILDTGHMLMHEGVGRTGGMMALKPVSITCSVANPVRYRPGPPKPAVGYDSVPGFADYVLSVSNALPGDVLMVSSVSGYNYFPVDLALKARDKGLLTVTISSYEYSSRLVSKHPSGKRLFEAGDYFLDNCTVYGDTLVPVPELEQSICPASGISASYLMWALQSTVVEKLLEMGLKPSVYISNHMPNATEHNAACLEQYTKLGY